MRSLPWFTGEPPGRPQAGHPADPPATPHLPASSNRMRLTGVHLQHDKAEHPVSWASRLHR